MRDFVLRVPEWKGEISFSGEVVTLLIVMIAMAAGIMMCFWGYRYFQTILLILLGCLCGICGYKISESMTDNLVLRMCIFVMFTFLGVSLLYFFSVWWTFFTRRLKIQAFLQRTIHIVSSLLGAAVVGGVLYGQVYRNLAVALITGAVFALAGILYGFRTKSGRRVFRTYEDLVKMPPLAEEENDA